MPAKGNGVKWVVPAVLMLLTALAARAGVSLLIYALAALPVVSAVLSYTSGKWGAAGVCAAAALSCAFTLPSPALIPALVWCAGCAAVPCVPLKNKILRPVMWGSLCVLVWLICFSLAMKATDGNTVNGIAQALCNLTDQSPYRDTILLNAYSMGLARLKGTEGLIPAVRVMGNVVIEEATRTELLNSLRVSLEETLPALLCDLAVYHTALTVLLCTLLPDWRRRRHGEEGELPPIERWYMPRRMGAAVFALGLGWLLLIMSDGGISMYMGLLSTAVFRAAFTVQGVGLMIWLEKKVGVRAAARNFWAVLLSVLAPIVPIVLGVIDQRRDARHLRPHKEAE